jgi:hypothetical protein
MEIKHMVTAKEAKRILLEQRRRNRERQKEHMERMRAEGYRRIAVMISGEAHKVLEETAKDTEKTKAELVTNAILATYDEKNVNIQNKNNISTNANIQRETKQKLRSDYDREAALKRMIALSADGLSHRDIAERMTAEGIPTAKGGAWNRGTIGKWLKQWEKNGKK